MVAYHLKHYFYKKLVCMAMDLVEDTLLHNTAFQSDDSQTIYNNIKKLREQMNRADKKQ